ncbi:acyl-CoA dehydrogenase family protein [Novosphingobium sp. EMRT-2]|uniref:acyl-CoA dehydrogenase family protein n=1 Tax=Novosphingobium sp. EMRT-2 TaxID=2571749 RepID=UPI0010BD1946|nr:acyl-CoA dehydrogenase family protein [Novosphingobium sp. EMRT-2]QCI95843.1 flavin-dependent monooxygenase [Novosphingobium sp. EMRT-2]
MNVALDVRKDVNALDRLLLAVREQRETFSENQQVSADVVRLMREAGLYRAMVAKRFGGDEMSPASFLRLIETISQVDGSSGWVASFGFSAVYLSALPLPTLEKMYANGPDVIFAGGIYPPQRAVPVDGGLEVSGRWSWGSGSTGADLIGVGIKVENGANSGPYAGLPLIAVMPADKVTIERNWDVNGLKGTGSHDMVVDKVVVPEEWTFVRGGASSLDTPLYRYPSMPLAAQVLSVVALGTARGALDCLIEMAGGRTSITGAPTLADRAYLQTDVAKAEAALRSARAFFYEITEEAYDTLVAGDDLSIETRALLRLASTQAARVGADVAQAVYRLSGTTGIATNHPIARHLQDAMVVPQHAFLSDGTWQNAGRVLLGLDAPAGFP